MSAPTIFKIQHLYDEVTRRWFSVYRAAGLEGNDIEAIVPREETSVAKVTAHLLSAGANITVDEPQIREAIASDAPIVHRAGRTGWRQDGEVFVSPLGVNGRADLVSGVLPPKDAASNVGGLIQLQGTLSGWQELIDVAKFSTAFIICLCALFAAPLLALVDRSNFAVMLYGRSRSKKSTVQWAAASALGFARDDDLPTLGSTPAGLLAAACACNDHAFFINEAGTAKGGKKDVASSLYTSTYALMSGKDIMRHPHFNGGMSNVPATFRTIVIVSSEFSPDEWSERSGIVRDPGETARMIGVPAIMGDGETVFDMWPSGQTLDSESDWADEQTGYLKSGLAKETGVAFQAYCSHLVHNRRRVERNARWRIARFESHLRPYADTLIARDIVAKFGVLYAGGLAAGDAGIWTIEKGAIGKAVKRACIAALQALPDPQADLRHVLDVVQERLSGGGIVDRDTASKKQVSLMRQADGFSYVRAPGQVFVVRTSVISTWFSPSRYRAFLEWTDDNGYLEHQADRANGRSNQWAHGTPRWPDGTKQRSVTLYFPNGLSDLKLVVGALMPTRASGE